MPPVLARPVAVLVIAALGYAQIGYFLCHEAQRIATQRSIKDQVRKWLPRERLTPFRMSEQDWQALDWVKPEREFRLADGSMFDVVTVTVSGGEVDALCIADHEEAGLFMGLKEHVRRQMEGGDPEHGPSAQVQRLMQGMEPPPTNGGPGIPACLLIIRTSSSPSTCLAGYGGTWPPPPKA